MVSVDTESGKVATCNVLSAFGFALLHDRTVMPRMNDTKMEEGITKVDKRRMDWDK